MHVCLFLAFFSAASMSQVLGLQCVDESGSAVDWLIMYKLPKEAGKKHHPESAIADGKVSCVT
jgi:Deoxyribonuclease II